MQRTHDLSLGSIVAGGGSIARNAVRYTIVPRRHAINDEVEPKRHVSGASMPERSRDGGARKPARSEPIRARVVRSANHRRTG